ncbi:MAG: copper chaperone PCu(A)C [Sedimenticolaceae bacterium]
MTSTKRPGWRNTGALMLLLALSAGVSAADGIAGKVSVVDPYVRAVPPVAKTSAAFMQLRNDNDTEGFLVSADTPAASVVELHTHTMDEGVMRMRQVPQIPLPPNTTVSLEPGGLHIMLFDLKAPLSPGDEVPITLTFSDGSSKAVTAEVRSVQGMMKH